MPFEFTPTIKPFVAACLYESLTTPAVEQRRANFYYGQGVQVYNRGNRYISIQAGITGPGIGPTATSGTQNDGAVVWLALGPDKLSSNSINGNFYLGIGKQTPWDNPSAPDAPDVSPISMSQALDDVTCFLRLNSSNMRLGFEAHEWTTGTVYSQYDPSIDQLDYPTPSYVVVGGSFIYRCLDNNNDAPSTVEPFGTNGGIIELSDGYIWKYIGTISNSELFEFGTSTFAPVPQSGTLAEEDLSVGSISTFGSLTSSATPFDELDDIATVVYGDGSGASATARVSILGGQKTITGLFASNGGSLYTDAFAVAYNNDAPGTGCTLEVDLDAGAIDSITVLQSGEDYVEATVLIIGDGSGAEAEAIISSGQIAAINVTNGGSDYTWARAFVIPGTAGAVARAIMAPVGGHGSNLPSELNASTLLISATLASSLNNYIPTDTGGVDGSFRQVTLVSNIQPQSGTPRNQAAYIGPSHIEYNNADAELDKYQQGTGFVLYMNNIVAVTHTATQEEIIKISITF